MRNLVRVVDAFWRLWDFGGVWVFLAALGFLVGTVVLLDYLMKRQI
jgi:hypothetical protein